MAINSLNDLFMHFLKDIYYAEKQLVKALPKMADKATAPKLASAFQNHLKETEQHVARLEKVFDICGEKPVAETCEAIQGIIKESTDIMNEADDPEVRDAGLVAAGQAAEHYEIARYGTLVAWACQLQLNDAADILNETLDEEYAADKKLSAFAENSLNKKAA